MNVKRLLPFAAIFVVALAVAIVAAIAVSQPAPAAANGNGFQILPPDGRYQGKYYGEWAKRWHQWVLRIPAEDNPMFDETGDKCAEGQRGNVWYLTGTFGGGTITRHCEVPKNRPVFFPVQNAMWLPFPDDPEMSEEERAEMEDAYYAWVAGAEASASIDDVEVDDLMSYHFNSGWFDTWMPDDNIIDYLVGDPDVCDWPTGNSGPHFNDGIYLMVMLDEGDHTIHFTGWDGDLDVTYELEVE